MQFVSHSREKISYFVDIFCNLDADVWNQKHIKSDDGLLRCSNVNAKTVLQAGGPVKK